MRERRFPKPLGWIFGRPAAASAITWKTPTGPGAWRDELPGEGSSARLPCVWCGETSLSRDKVDCFVGFHATPAAFSGMDIRVSGTDLADRQEVPGIYLAHTPGDAVNFAQMSNGGRQRFLAYHIRHRGSSMRIDANKFRAPVGDIIRESSRARRPVLLAAVGVGWLVWLYRDASSDGRGLRVYLKTDCARWALATGLLLSGVRRIELGAKQLVVLAARDLSFVAQGVESY